MRARAAVFAGYLALAFGSAPPVKLPSAVAVLALSKADQNEVIAIESNLEMLGVPFESTHSVVRAIQAPMVILAGTLTNGALRAGDRERLYSFVESGGVLFATQVQANLYDPLFGLAGFSSTRKNSQVRFVESRTDPALRYINRPEERDISFGDAKQFQQFNWTTQYETAGAMTLARYANGAAAFVRNEYGRGLAYSLGMSFSDSTLRLSLGQSYGAQPAWANVFAPAGDVIRTLLRAIYEANVHPFILVHTIPNGLESALLLSHDLDARESFANAVVFAAMEQRYGTASTFFATTKYFSDDTDTGYYTPANARHLAELVQRGFDVGSHTVSHLKTFHRFPLGAPAVRFATYRPLEAPSVFGEVAVSKELLERDVPGQHTIAFRAGELSHPPQLIRALETSGYLVDSTRAAGESLTNYAYRPLRESHLGADVSGMIEIPVTLDDSMGYLTPASLERAVAEWIHIVEANAENGAITCLLVHPTDITYKLAAEERLLQVFRNKPVWIGSLLRFGLFARARAPVRIAALAGEKHLLLRLNQPKAALPGGLTLTVESVRRSENIVVQDSLGDEIPFAVKTQLDRKFLILHP